MEEDKILIEYYNNDFIINIDLENHGTYKAIINEEYYITTMILCNVLKEILNDGSNINRTTYSVEGVCVLRDYTTHDRNIVITINIRKSNVVIYLRGIMTVPLDKLLGNEFINKVSDASTVYSEEFGRYLTTDDMINIIGETNFHSMIDRFKTNLTK